MKTIKQLFLESENNLTDIERRILINIHLYGGFGKSGSLSKNND